MGMGMGNGGEERKVMDGERGGKESINTQASH